MKRKVAKANMEQLTQNELAFLLFLQKLRHPLLEEVMKTITHSGDYGAVWIIITLGLLANKKTRRAGLCLACALLTMQLTGNAVLKNLVARQRPFTHIPGMVSRIGEVDGLSFPSGHTFSSFTAATVIGLFFKRFKIPAYAYASMIALSRLYFFVHFPTDVLGGALMGILNGHLWYNLIKEYEKEDFQKLIEKFKKKK